MKSYLYLILIFILSIQANELLSDHEKKWIQNHPVITLGVDNRFKPMNYSDNHGELIGLNIDFIRLIETKIDFKFNFEEDSWPKVFPKAMNHEIDGIINADKTEEREQKLIFTDVFAHHPLALYVNKKSGINLSLSNLQNRKIGVKANTSTYRFLKENHPEAIVVEYLNLPEALFGLIQNEIDAVCDWHTVLDNSVKEHFLEDIVPSQIFLDNNIGRSRIGIRNDYPELVSILNKAIMDITQSEKDSIYNKWIKDPREKQLNYETVWRFILIPLIIILLFTVWNFKLSKEIKKRKITESKLGDMIQKLRMSDEQRDVFSDRLELALKSSKAGIWDLDLKENVLVWDDRMYELYGIEKTADINNYEAWQKGLHPDDLEKASKEVELAIAGQKPFDTVFRIVWPNQSIHYIKASAEIKRDVSGNAIRMIGVNFDVTDQKATEEKQLLSEKRLRQVQAISGIGYWDLNIETGELEWSDEVFKIFGMKKKKGKMLLQDFINRIHPDDKDDVLQIYQDSIKNKSKYEIIHKVIQEDYGEVRYVVEHCEHTFNEKGDAVRSLGTIHDITDQILLEEEKKNFFDMSQDFVGIAEFNAHFRFVNKAFLDILGYTDKELKEKTFFDFIHPDDHTKTGEAMSILIKGEAVTDFENRYITKNGEIRWLSWRANPDLEKGFIYYVARDITFSKIAENELKKNREQLRTIIDSVNSLIFMKDVNGYYLIVNKAYERTVGVSSIDVLGKTEYDLFPKEIADPIVEMDKNIIRNRDEVTYEEDVRLKDGLIHNFITTKVPLFNEDGTVYGLVGMAVDITSRKKMEQELLHAKNVAEESYKAKSEFLANMSHEIRTPLNAVTGFSELLTTMVKDEKQRSYLNSIKTAGKALLHLINDVLDLSKLEAGKVQLNKDCFNISNLIKEISDIFYLDVKRKKIEFIIQISENVPNSISLDIGRLRQVMLNLIGNAVKFTNDGFIKVNVNTASKNDTGSLILVIEVEDSGIGIGKSDQERVFENFRQQSGQDNRKYGGTGLGLSICKKLVELMNGEIKLISELNIGSKFIVNIPLDEYSYVDNVECVEDENVIKNLDDIKFLNKKIWLVDDTESSRNLIEEVLNKVGLSSRSFSSAVDVCKQLKRGEAPDLIITDIRMPKMNGFELLNNIKQFNLDKEFPVIALSATGNNELDFEKTENRFDAYLKKPVELVEFYKILKEFIPIIPITSINKIEEVNEIVPIELIKFIENDFYDSVCQLSGGLKVKEVMNIGESLLNESMKYNSEMISSFAQKIIDAADNMDIVFIKSIKEDTEKLLNRIRGEANV